ncbi:MAG: holdfast anchoring protein HfaB [Alphaproteobacteria bacterium]|nr:holdfast anchoring protein HfaB [Alphaproteobacteria bacterium]
MASSPSIEARPLRKSGLLTGLAAIALAGSLSGCISPVALSDGKYTQPIGNAPVITNETPYSEPLRCMARYIRADGRLAPRIAVGRIADYTGKEEFEGGRKVTQGASLMAISALAKSGVRLVERFDTSVSELELKYANNKLIGDDLDTSSFRRILAGSIPGSDYYLVGGITELNYNIRSVGGDAFVGDIDPQDLKGNVGAKLYVMNVGLDLRLVDTRSLEVVDVISYQKQIIGRELRAGIFGFFNDNIFDIGIGERALEPIQLAVRAVVERATLEMIAGLYRVGPDICLDHSRPDADPLGEDLNGDGVIDAKDTEIQTIPEQRREPYRWVREAKLKGSMKE